MLRKQIIADASKILLMRKTKNIEILETVNHVHKENKRQTQQTNN
jgi:hypothetical protein